MRVVLVFLSVSISLQLMFSFLFIEKQLVPANDCYVNYLEDPNSTLKPLDFDSSQVFQPLNPTDNSFSFTKSTFWLSMGCTEGSEREIVRMGYPLLDYVDVFVKGQAEPIYELGDRSQTRSAMSSNQIAFNISPGMSYLVRVRTNSTMQLPVFFETAHDFFENESQQNLFLGFYYGIIISLVLYNLFLFFSLRQIEYLYYCSYLTCFGLFLSSLNGLGARYLWTFNTWWANQSLPFFTWLTFFFIFLFTREFLSKSLTPGQERFININALGTLGAAVLTPFIPYKYTIAVASLFCFYLCGSLMVLGFRSMLVGFKPARFFVLAWSSFLVGIVFLNLRNFGILPNSFFTNYSVQIGSTIEMLLLSLALGYKYRTAIIQHMTAERNLILANEEKRKSEEQAMAYLHLAHDIRSPLGVLSTLLQRSNLSETNGDLAKRALARIYDVANDLLHRGQSSSPKTEASNICKVDQIIESSVKEKQIEYQGVNNLTITGKKLESEEIVAIKPLELKRVLSNLINNSIEAIGNKEGQVEVSLTSNDRSVCISIKDNGCGMPENILESLNSNNYITFGKEEHETAGNGLGLASSSKIVSNANGRLRFYSKLGKGTIATIELPKN